MCHIRSVQFQRSEARDAASCSDSCCMLSICMCCMFYSSITGFWMQQQYGLWCCECGHRGAGSLPQEPPSETFLMQFGLRVAQLLCPSVAVPQVFAAVRQAIGESRAAAGEGAGPRPEPPRKLELVFAHDCR